jgi:hypothetical protein
MESGTYDASGSAIALSNDVTVHIDRRDKDVVAHRPSPYQNLRGPATLQLDLASDARRRYRVPQSTLDIVSKLADKGEEALQKISASPARTPSR